MKLISSLVLAAGALALAAGCSKKENAQAPAASPAPAASAPAANPAPVAAAGGRTIAIEGNDTMKFSVVAIEAKPGEELTIELKNTGAMPKEAMGHNWVLLKKGTDVNAFSVAAMTAKDKDYIPPSMAAQVIAHTKVLGPKQTDKVTFKAPAEAGDYPYLCSFPAHAMTGMKGILTVK